MGNNPSDSTRPELDELLRVAAIVDASIEKDSDNGLMTGPGGSYGGIEVPAPGFERLVEDLILARRIFASVFALMNATKSSTSNAGDHTESAAVLLRRLTDILGDILWMTGVPAEHEGFPVSIGDLDVLVGEAHDLGWDAMPEAGVFCMSLAVATAWTDAQALRATRRDLNKQRLVAREIVERRGGDCDDEEAVALKSMDARIHLIETRLVEMGASTSKPYDHVTLFKRYGTLDLLTLWRHASDVEHGGVIGRSLQRGGPGEPMFGAAATPERRSMVMELSTAVLSWIAVRVFEARSVPTTNLDQAVEVWGRLRPLTD